MKERQRPAGYIGAPLPRADAKRLLEGEGRFVDDVPIARLAHIAFLRSPFAHARIVRLDTQAARSAPGVVAVLTGADVARLCTPYTGILTHIPGMRSVPQYPMAVERALWQGEPVAAVVAESRGEAEDALERIEVEWEELPTITDPRAALEDGAPILHPTLGDNLCYARRLDSEDVDEAFARADHVIEVTFETARHTPVSLEPRSIAVEYRRAENRLTVWHSTQVPYMVQWLLAHHFSLPETHVRVIAPDVGGSFGLKIHTYGDELTTVAAAILTQRPVKFVADRLEAFVSDIHARGHTVAARIGVSRDGDIVALEIDDLVGIGAYSIYPRGSINEILQLVNLAGAPYGQRPYRGRGRAVFQNKAMYGQYRAVGHPIACVVTEGLADLAAAAVGMDSVAFRRRNYIPDDAYPYALRAGLTFERLSLHAALDTLVAMMGYDALREKQRALRERQIYRGIGIATFVENSNPSAASYGKGGASISAQDACTIKLTATGGLSVAASTNDFGQGARAVVAQIAASMVGVPIEHVTVQLGDTDATPYGGGNWGSRGTGIGGEAVLQAAKALRANILAFVARLIESEPSMLDVRDGSVVDASSGATHMTLEAVARTAYFRTDLVPADFQPELTVTRSYAQRKYTGVFTNGVHGSYLEVDIETGFVKLLKHWVVDDCGTVVNPLLADEQLRGGVVQGLGAALYEECLYTPEGQLANGSLVDYLVPMAAEMPDIEIGHTCTPTATSELGAKGAGEAGTAGAAAAVLNAVNDALRPLGVHIHTLPLTPQRILEALGKV